MAKTVQQTILELDEQAKRIRRDNPDIVNWPGAIEPALDDPMKPAMDGLFIALFNRLNTPAKPDEGEQR